MRTLLLRLGLGTAGGRFAALGDLGLRGCGGQTRCIASFRRIRGAFFLGRLQLSHSIVSHGITISSKSTDSSPFSLSFASCPAPTPHCLHHLPAGELQGVEASSDRPIGWTSCPEGLFRCPYPGSVAGERGHRGYGAKAGSGKRTFTSLLLQHSSAISAVLSSI